MLTESCKLNMALTKVPDKVLDEVLLNTCTVALNNKKESCDQFLWYVFGFWTIAAVVEAADVEWQRSRGCATCKMPEAALRVCAVLVNVFAASTVTFTVFVSTLYLAQLIQI